MLVIFDCDGVLVDSEPLACASFSRALKAQGLDWSVEETMRRLMGLSLKTGVEICEAELGRKLPDDFVETMQAIDEIVRQLAAEDALDDLDTGFHRAAHQAPHRLLDRPIEPVRLERRREAPVGERLTVDQHAVTIENDQHSFVSKACHPPQ